MAQAGELRTYQTRDDSGEDWTWHFLVDDDASVQRLFALQAHYYASAQAAGLTFAKVPAEPREIAWEQVVNPNLASRSAEAISRGSMNRLDAFEKRASV